jgi:hypothetical protein
MTERDDYETRIKSPDYYAPAKAYGEAIPTWDF